MDSLSSSDLSVLARQLDMPLESVEVVSKLLDAGNTAPFLARYRRDEIGGLTAQQVSKIKNRLDRRRQLEERKQVILKAITTRGKLTDELEKLIRDTHSAKVLEDRYLPFKVKKQNNTDELVAKGLDPLADAILAEGESKSVEELAAGFVDTEKGVATVEDAISGARELIEERFNHNIDLRKSLRRIIRRTGVLNSTRAEDDSEQSQTADGSPPPEDASSESAASESAPHAGTPHDGAPPESSPSESAAATNPSGGATATTEAPKDTASPNDSANGAATEQGDAEKSAASAESTGESTKPVSADGSGDSAGASPPPSGDTTGTDKAADSGAKADEKKPEPNAKRTSRVTATGVTLSKEARRQLRREARHRKRKRLESSFKDFFDFHESVAKIREHKILSIDRGERFRVLNVNLTVDNESVSKEAETILVPADHPRADFLRECVKSSLDRLVLPSLERDLRRELTDRAELHAIRAFSGNLKKLLLRKPLTTGVLAIAPSYRSGCNVAVLDETGAVLEHKQLQLIGTDDRKEASKKECLAMIERHGISVVAIGTSKGSREAEQLVGGWIQKELSNRDVRYAIVNDSGVNRYATSVLAGEELPNLNPGAREAAAIGRRLIDPLSEFVKIEPGSINVGTYPEEMKAKPIQDSLGAVVFECVNDVGVDVNTASKALLRNVAGLNQLSAQRICEHRAKNGPFKSRAEFAEVDGLNDAARSQASGFLRVMGGENPLDETRVHPDNYAVAEKLLEKAGSSLSDLRSYLTSLRPIKPPPATAAKPESPKPDPPTPEAPNATDATADSSESSSSATSQTSDGADPPQPVTPPAAESATPPANTSDTPPTDPASAEKTPPGETSTDKAKEPTPEPAAETGATEAENVAKTAAPPNENSSAENTATNADAAKPVWDFAEKSSKFNSEELANELGVGKCLVENLIAELSKPGYDLRTDNKGPTLRKGAISFESLSPGMAINGTVSNVVEFGVFVDIGLKEAGLVHISRMADHFIRDPNELFSAGQSLQVWVVEVDEKKRRVALTAIDPDAEKSTEAKPRSQKPRSGKPNQGKAPRGKKGNRRGDRPRSFQSKPRRAPKPVKPITEGMIEGKEPMRTFSDLLQFADKKRKGDDKKKGS